MHAAESRRRKVKTVKLKLELKWSSIETCNVKFSYVKVYCKDIISCIITVKTLVTALYPVYNNNNNNKILLANKIEPTKRTNNQE